MSRDIDKLKKNNKQTNKKEEWKEKRCQPP